MIGPDNFFGQFDRKQLLDALLHAESGGNPNAVNKRSGAAGLAQVMPATARDPGYGLAPLRDPFDPRASRDFASRYLGKMEQQFQSPTLAMVAYNWGPGNAQKWVARGADPKALPKETYDYVNRIARKLGQPPSSAPTERLQARAPDTTGTAGDDVVAGGGKDDSLDDLDRQIREAAATPAMPSAKPTEPSSDLTELDRQIREAAGAKNVSQAEDIARSAAEGVVSGAAAVPGMFGDVQQLGGGLADWTADKLGLGKVGRGFLRAGPIGALLAGIDADVSVPQLPTTADVRGAIPIDQYQPQTPAGDYLKSGVEGAVGMFGPGGIAVKGAKSIPTVLGRNAIQGAAAGVGGEAGRDFAETVAPGSTAAQVVGSLAGAFGGARAAGAAQTKVAKRPEILPRSEGGGLVYQDNPNLTPAERKIAKPYDELTMPQKLDVMDIEPKMASAFDDSPRATKLEKRAVAHDPGRIKQAAAETLESVENRLHESVQDFGKVTEPAEAGMRIQKSAERWTDKWRARDQANFDKIAADMADQPVTVENTRRFGGLTADKVSAADRVLMPKKLRRLVDQIDEEATAGTLNYADLKQIRSDVGDIAFGGKGNPYAKKLYGSLSQDMRASIEATGNPQLIKDFERANAFHSRGLEIKKRTFAKALGDNDPEVVYRWTMSGATDGHTRLSHVMRRLDPDARQSLSRTVLERMGRDTPNGDFSMEAFVKGFNKMNPRAREVLFNGFGLRDKYRDLSRTLELADVVLNNNTAKLAKMPVNERDDVMKWFKWMRRLSPVGAGHVLFGNPVVSGAIVGTQATMAAGKHARNAYAARLLTSPDYMRWLATPPGEGGVSRKLSALATIASENPELAEPIAEMLKVAKEEGES